MFGIPAPQTFEAERRNSEVSGDVNGISRLCAGAADFAAGFNPADHRYIDKYDFGGRRVAADEGHLKVFTRPCNAVDKSIDPRQVEISGKSDKQRKKFCN